MRILFAFNHHHLPLPVGGAELSTHLLCKLLLHRGIEVAVHSRAQTDSSGPSLVGEKSDKTQGYCTFRVGDTVKELSGVCAQFNPDIVVALSSKQVELATEAEKSGFPSMIYFHDAAPSRMDSLPIVGKNIGYLSISNYVSKTVAQRGIFAPVIRPIIMPNMFSAHQHKPRYVTFVNPVSVKGVDKAIAIARENSDIPFLFIDCWDNEPELLAQRKAQAAECKNIEWIPYTREMTRDVYSVTKLLLVPSVWDEGYTRVVAEAHMLGIPALASKKGGLLEAVGSGGINVGYEEPISAWTEALRLMWFDSNVHMAFSKLALQHANRSEMKSEVVVSEFLSAVTAFLEVGR